MKGFFGALKRFNHWALGIAGWIVVAGMALISVVIPYEVFGRYFLGSVPHWSGELTVFTLVWISMLGAAVGLPKGYQIGLTYFLNRLPPGGRRVVRVLGNLVVLAILSVLFYFGVEQTRVNLHQVSPALQIPMALPYLAIPAGAMLMWMVSLEQIFETIGNGGQQHRQKAVE